MLAALRARRPTPRFHRVVRGDRALVFGLHGYGGDELQLDSLLPIVAPVTSVVPRGPHRVDPGFGWWLPAADGVSGVVELANPDRVTAAVNRIVNILGTVQADEGLGPDRTVLIGYSQGATLALEVAARHPAALAAVITGAGGLVTEGRLAPAPKALDMLIMNGRLDPVVDADWHTRTVAAFTDAGHSVTDQLDDVPHVIDQRQAAFANAWLADRLQGLSR